MFSGDVDVVYGAKGSGKSAIYSLLFSHEAELRGRGIQVVAGGNPRGTPIFRELVTDPPAGEEEFRGLWKLYFLCLVGQFLRSSGSVPDSGVKVLRKLEEARLLPPDGRLSGMLRSVMDYVRRADSIGIGVEIDKATGMPSGVLGKITLREPNFSLQEAGLISVDELLRDADSALEKLKLNVWLLLDRLDVVFTESDDLESNAIRGLFRVYLDLQSLKAIDIKIFLRTDIWSRIKYKGDQGFREASHISRHTTISWSNQSLVNLIVRRFLHNEAIRKAYGADAILADSTKQLKFLGQMLPPQGNFDWLLSRLRDGSRATAPRELIHFLDCAKKYSTEETGTRRHGAHGAVSI
jgi:hypothetical protein